MLASCNPNPSKLMVGLFPDVIERKVAHHMEKGDHVSALVTGEFYTKNHFPGFGWPFVFNAKVLLKVGSKLEAKDAARGAVKLPWWTLGCRYQEVAEIADWEEEQIVYIKEKVSEEGKIDDLKKRKAPEQILNCQESVIYVLAPLRYATVYGCSDATIVLGAIGKAVRVEHCERVQIITAAKRISIANCRECIFFLGVNQRPLIIRDNHKLQVAPYNTFYSQLAEYMAQVGVDPTVNRWSEPVVLRVVDPHDSLSHPVGASDDQSESTTCLDPDQFTNFLIPNWFGVDSPPSTKYNLFPLPEAYLASQRKKHMVLGDVQQAIRNLQVEENRRRELASALHLHFKDWLYGIEVKPGQTVKYTIGENTCLYLSQDFLGTERRKEMKMYNYLLSVMSTYHV